MRWFSGIYSALLLVVCIAIPAFAQSQDDSVIDLNAKWHFTWVGDPYSDLYSDGNNTLLCVRSATGQYALWNPVSNSLSARLSRKCRATSTLHRTTPEIGHGVKVATTSESSNCGRIFSFYDTVAFSNGRGESFYVLGKLKTPLQQDEYWCAGTRNSGTRFTQAFAQISAKEMTLEDGSLLLVADAHARSGMCSACWDEFLQPTLLRIRAVPASITPLGGDVFIVPKSILDPVLESQGDDNSGRYRAVMNAIGRQSGN